jgi:hypothetical protein
VLAAALGAALSYLVRRASAHLSAEAISHVLAVVSHCMVTTALLALTGVFLLVGVTERPLRPGSGRDRRRGRAPGCFLTKIEA